MTAFKGKSKSTNSVSGDPVFGSIQPQKAKGVPTAGQPALSGLPKKGNKGANPRFIAKWNPLSVAYVEQLGGWVYDIRQFHMAVGLDQIQRDLEGLRSNAIPNNTRRGWHMIHIGDERLGKYADYVDRYPLEQGGYRHVYMWIRPTVVGNQTFWDEDIELHKAFVQQCMGFLPQITDHVKRLSLQRQEHRVGQIETALLGNPTSKLLLDRYSRQSRTLALMKGGDPDEAANAAKEFARIKRAESIKAMESVNG